MFITLVLNVKDHGPIHPKPRLHSLKRHIFLDVILRQTQMEHQMLNGKSFINGMVETFFL